MKKFFLLLLTAGMLLSMGCGAAEDAIENTPPAAEQQEEASPEESPASPAEPAREYDFPLQSAEVKELSTSLSLNWEEMDVFEEDGRSGILYRMMPENAYFSITSGEAGKARFLELAMADFQEDRNEPLNSIEEFSEPLLSLCQQLYGQDNQAQEIFSGLLLSRPEKIWEYPFNWRSQSRQDDLCYSLELRFVGSMNHGWLYELARLEISGFQAYEAQQRALADALLTEKGGSRVGLDALSPSAEGSYYSVLGSLSKLRSDETLWPEAEEGWQVATLSADGQSQDVLLLPSCYLEEELAEEREHLLLCQEGLPLPVLLYSPLPQ
ncbi:MAG: hypothetical protein Q4B50_07790 [Bacillota bacterium]|nr:hypothetical protein [Bacillota bacterium]